MNIDSRNRNFASNRISAVRRSSAVHRLVAQSEQARADLSTSAQLLTEAPGLPSYSSFARVKIVGLDANLVVGTIFAAACFGFAFVLFPAILLSAGVSYFIDRNRRR